VRWKINSYRVHRWFALVVGLQLLIWSTSGFIFSILDLDNVHGDLDRVSQIATPLNLNEVTLSPSQAIQASNAPVAPISVTLREYNGRIGYEIVSHELKDNKIINDEITGPREVPIALVDALTGAVQLRISESEARQIALADFKGETTVASVEFLEGDPPSEYRGGRMPVYRVTLEHSKQIHVYICPVMGRVLLRRNKVWRIFDFFWMLHIMDYNGRDNFNHLLLQSMSLLAILTSASGIFLWWLRRPKWMRRKNRQLA
jgi:uncharacterized iron-regulated membrane protein